jgi:hypothetical protein
MHRNVRAIQERLLEVTDFLCFFPKATSSDDLISHIFYPCTLQLRDTGHEVLRTIVQSWTYDFDVLLTGQARIKLAAMLQYPYHIKVIKNGIVFKPHHEITFYGKSDAALYEMYNNAHVFLDVPE